MFNEIEAGYYGFRAVATSSDGSLETLYSKTYEVVDKVQLKLYAAQWKGELESRGYSNIQLTHTFPQEKPKSWGSYMQGQPIVANAVPLVNNASKDTGVFDLTLSELNGEFILDI